MQGHSPRRCFYTLGLCSSIVTLSLSSLVHAKGSLAPLSSDDAEKVTARMTSGFIAILE